MRVDAQLVPVRFHDAPSQRDYVIVIGDDLLTTAIETIREHVELPHVILITDSDVAPLYAEQLQTQCTTHKIPCDLIVVEAGEASKSISEISNIWNKMLAANTRRTSVVVAVGGGVVGDLAGFAAASFARGLALVQIPTTLLAQVDSSVGGKVGINLATAKNMVGHFWQPRLVLADIKTLETLPRRQFTAGMAEVVKYGVIDDSDFFEWLETDAASIISRDPTHLIQMIARCCQIKADVVAADETETTGRRAILNYGHTIGHGLEAVLGYGQLLHGEAVAIGMHCAARLAKQRNLVDDAFVKRQEQLLNRFGLPTGIPHVDEDQLWQAIIKDKKNDQDGVRFVLPTRLGAVSLFGEIQRREVMAALD